MAEISISHMLIVAGPSGAGKSTFLRELAAGRLPPEVSCHLPEGARTWQEVWCNRPKEWQPFISVGRLATKVPGIAVHYDITTKWLHLNRALERDPFWDLLHHCEAATIVNIRPSRQRLLRQWIHAHLGVDNLWSAYRKRALFAFSNSALSALRQLRTARPHNRKPHIKRYPRRIRFLRHWETFLQRFQFPLSAFFDFYSRRGEVERMLSAWDAVAAKKLNGLSARQIEMTPSSDGEIAKTFRWHIVEVGGLAK